MSEYEIPYISLIIQTFANRFAMTRQAAYNYLQKHQGLAALIEYYDVMHLEDPEESVDDLAYLCKREGGEL